MTPATALDSLDLAARRDLSVRAAVEQRLLSDDEPLIALLDLTTVRDTVRALHAGFAEAAAPGQQVLHTFAVKACSLVPVLRLLDRLGVGCEAASPGELALARAAGVPAARIVLDSPAKTTAELREALRLGIAVNADSVQELDRLDALLAGGRAAPAGALGVRINPQLGAGRIGAMSTATATSKFGIPLADSGARAWLVRAFLERPWLTRLHCHVGSQGMPTEVMAAGARALLELADEINEAAGERRVTTLDIGGGLPVNFGSDEFSPTHADYARQLRAAAPGLFDGRYGLVTEFGRSLVAKAGLVLARVEYVKTAGGRRIALTHAGAQIATRTVFAPEAWPLRVAAYDGRGRPKDAPEVRQDVAGPCCFAGDLVARDRLLPRLEQGDLAVLLDTGAYYASTPFGYNSLPRPAVYGVTFGADQVPSLSVLRRPQSLAELVAESGG
ncbi:diaminopimelate decarboxylase [Streptomyces aidingensis]|uniref:Diaminopimelate decarboxylase n=1 Tax=Streptomyces aidingensis TaxID=910347 RepID=A0A1I1NX45_9ACTN|nr:diaminopimelate decarboxylase [Streptomyces aidingensis]SFC98290.1 diaminopimelate decarboxylase [Streptomyces aidingensis]